MRFSYAKDYRLVKPPFVSNELCKLRLRLEIAE